MSRSQFTFYESFARALSRIKKKSDRADAYDAICNYALYGTEPDMDKLPDSAAIAFDLIRPTLDASKRKAEAGKSGGMSKKSQTERKQTGSKQEANRKLEQTSREKEKEVEIEKEIENECYTSPPLPPTGKAAAVIADYLNRINASASQTTIDELKGYAESMGPDVCKRAFDIALDSKKASWPYIRAILQDKQARGVKCLADWDELDARREESKPRRQNLQPACDRTAPDKRAVEDMARMRRMLAEMREEESRGKENS